METKHLDKEIERYEDMYKRKDLSKYGEGILTEYKAIKKALNIDRVSNLLVNKVEPKGSWFFEISSGYAGLRCQKCSTWIYEEQPKKCTCDNAL